MSLTASQWNSRIRSWVPTWFLQEERYAAAILAGMARLGAEIGDEAAELVLKTFIGEAEAEWLDTHGDERAVRRNPLEADDVYRIRIRLQSFLFLSNVEKIKAVVDSLLLQGECQVREDYRPGPFIGFDYCNRDAIMIDEILNAFSIIIPKQEHLPYTFVGRDAYASRENFIGTISASEELYTAIISAVDAIKAFGALYRIFLSNNQTVFEAG